jgi:hypothetical protein
MKTRQATIRVLAGLFGCALLSSALASRALDGWDIKTPEPAIPFEPEVLANLDALSCTECHREVVEEWAGSAHGLAWVDEEYQSSLEDRKRPEKCYDCHIPQNLVETGALVKKVVPREDDLVHGISCDACHLGPDGAYLGPHGAPTAAHASVQSELHTDGGSDALCIICHERNVGPVIGIAKDYEKKYRSGEGAETCVGCHMAPVERQWGLPAEGEEPPPVRAGRSHALQTPRDPGFLRRAFELSVVREGEGYAVVIANRAGHRVPGLVGRELEFRAEVLDDAGKTLAEAEIVINKRRFLPVGGEQRIVLEQAGSEVRVRAYHDEPRARKPIEFLDTRLPLEP